MTAESSVDVPAKEANLSSLYSDTPSNIPSVSQGILGMAWMDHLTLIVPSSLGQKLWIRTNTLLNRIRPCHLSDSHMYLYTLMPVSTSVAWNTSWQGVPWKVLTGSRNTKSSLKIESMKEIEHRGAPEELTVEVPFEESGEIVLYCLNRLSKVEVVLPRLLFLFGLSFFDYFEIKR